MKYGYHQIRFFRNQGFKTTIDKLFNIIEYSIEFNKKLVIGYQNLHGLFLVNKNKCIDEFFKRSDVITIIDGMPLIFIGKLLKYDLKRENRLAWIDFIEPLLEKSSENNWRVFYLGTSQETAEKVKEKARSKYNLAIECRNGFFNAALKSNENIEVIDQINSYQPDLLIVGMSMPRQEIWISENKSTPNAKAIMTCGAAFEFLTGTAKVPPRWLGNLGLEWLFRLISDPKKLWYRYLIEPWCVFFAFCKQRITNLR